MTQTVYIVLICVLGTFSVGVGLLVFAQWWRRRSLIIAANSKTPEEEMIRRLETMDRVLRDELARNREEAGNAAKSQREELSKSLEGVRAIVDIRLKEMQQDNAKQIDKMRA